MPTLVLDNFSPFAYRGWLTCTVPQSEHPNGFEIEKNGVRFVYGLQVGQSWQQIHVWHSDLRGSLVSDVPPPDAERPLLPLPIDPSLVPAPSIAGLPMDKLSAVQDGPGMLAHYRLRFPVPDADRHPLDPHQMLVADLWVRWYPDQPESMRAELMVTASNPDVPDVTAPIDPDHLLISWPDIGSIALWYGVGYGSPLLRTTYLADGQALSWAGLFVFPRHIKDTTSAMALVGNQTMPPVAVCVDVAPDAPFAVDSMTWATRNVAHIMAGMREWPSRQFGVTANSTVSGDQEDQGVYKCSEAFVAAGGAAACAWLRYIVALQQSKRPCQHRNGDGSPLALDLPQLVFWEARNHWHHGVSPNRLGKSRNITPTDTHGWWGPDREHWLLNTLTWAYRLTGSPALLAQIESQAVAYLYGETVDPRLSTSGPSSPRGIGRKCLAARNMLECLPTGDIGGLRHRLMGRAVDRWEEVIEPATRCEGMQVQRWYAATREQAPSWHQGLGQPYPTVWTPWQHGVGAYGLYVLGEYLVGTGVGKAMMQRAYECGLCVVTYGYSDEAVPKVADSVGEYSPGVPLPTEEAVKGVGLSSGGMFDRKWTHLGPWVVSQMEPGHPKASRILANLNADKDWLP